MEDNKVLLVEASRLFLDEALSILLERVIRAVFDEVLRVRSGVDPKLLLEDVHRVFLGNLVTSHIRHFHGFTLTANTDIMTHVEMVLRLVNSVARLVTSFVIALKLLLVVLADLLVTPHTTNLFQNIHFVVGQK